MLTMSNYYTICVRCEDEDKRKYIMDFLDHENITAVFNPESKQIFATPSMNEETQIVLDMLSNLGLNV